MCLQVNGEFADETIIVSTPHHETRRFGMMFFIIVVAPSYYLCICMMVFLSHHLTLFIIRFILPLFTLCALQIEFDFLILVVEVPLVVLN